MSSSGSIAFDRRYNGGLLIMEDALHEADRPILEGPL
jgi:hypothetical protein